MKYVFFLSFFLSRIESESNSMDEVQNSTTISFRVIKVIYCITNILYYEVCFFLVILFVMGEVQDFDQFVTFTEEANKSTSNCGIVIYLILFLPSHNVWYLFKKAKFWQQTTLYESPKIKLNALFAGLLNGTNWSKIWIRSIVLPSYFIFEKKIE